jgi:hypothetical protein
MASLWSEESAKTLWPTVLMASVEKHWGIIHMCKVIVLFTCVVFFSAFSPPKIGLVGTFFQTQAPGKFLAEKARWKTKPTFPARFFCQNLPL